MVFSNKYSQVLIEEFPNFAKSKSLNDAIELYSEGELINIHGIFSGLTQYVVNELIAKNETISQEEIDIYHYIEHILEQYSNFPEGSDERNYDEAACVCFLENLINIASRGKRLTYDRFIPYLGEKSKEFCRAWDEFTGVQSPGLW